MKPSIASSVGKAEKESNSLFGASSVFLKQKTKSCIRLLPFTRMEFVPVQTEQSKRFDIYRHPMKPRHTKQEFQKGLDYYSFGAILVEIAGWRPIWDVWADGSPAETFKAQLLATAEQKVPHQMGQDYAEATMKCLNGELATRDCSEQKAFFIEVVEVLGRLTSSRSRSRTMRMTLL
jgi:hypothetical protein